MTTKRAKPKPNENLNRNWVDQFYEEINQVLHRFNYFLVSTSFMFVAFVALITSSKSNELDWIIKAVSILGIILSLYFFQINYQQTRVAHTVREEKLNIPFKGGETERWALDSLRDVVRYIFKPGYFAKERPASHTWFIPVLFTLLWIFSFCWWLLNN